MYKKFKKSVGIALILLGFYFMVSSSFPGGVLMLLAGAILNEKVSLFLNEKFSFWQKKSFRVLSFLILFFLSLVFNGISSAKSENENKAKNTVIDFLKTDSTDLSIMNIRNLVEVGAMFNNANYSLKHPHDGYIKVFKDSVANGKICVFNPKLDYNKIYEQKYLKDIPKYGKLQDYGMIFKFDKENNLIDKKTFYSFSKNGSDTIENYKVLNLNEYFNNDIIGVKKKNLATQKIIDDKKKANEEKKKNFEENCLSAYDGAHTKFKDLIKENVNDPSSFEHIETRYLLKDGYALIIMSFRAKNGFGGLIKSSYSAKIRLSDCSIIEVIK